MNLAQVFEDILTRMPNFMHKTHIRMNKFIFVLFCFRFIMAELLHTERTYVKDLETAVKVSFFLYRAISRVILLFDGWYHF